MRQDFQILRRLRLELAAAALLLTLGAIGPAQALDMSGETPAEGTLYLPSESLIQSLLIEQGADAQIDVDRDLEIEFFAGANRYLGYAFMDRLDDDSIWNVRLTATIIEAGDYATLADFANSWNRDEIAVKLFVDESNNLVAEQNFSVQYGFNPDEFVENGYYLFVDGIERLETAAAEAGIEIAGSASSGSDSAGSLSGGSGAQSGDSPGTAVDMSQWPASAIGRIEMSDDGICTATLVGPDIVLTAAHCLFDEAYEPTEILSFKLGYENGEAIAEAGIVERILDPNHDPLLWNETNDIDGLDWALLRLDRPLGDDHGYLPIKALTNDELDALRSDGAARFRQIGYGSDDGEHAVERDGCFVEQWWDDDTYAHLCGTIPGDSGGPNLLEIEGEIFVVGIESSEIDLKELKGADMSVSASAFDEALADALRP